MRWSQNEVVGFLHRFWWTVLDYAPTGVVSALSLEVMAETLTMDVQELAKAMSAMEDVGLLSRRSGKVVVHDWVNYAGEFLRTNKFRRQPEKWKEVQALYADAIPSPPGPSPPKPGDMSRDMSPDMSRVPDLPDLPNLPGGGDEGRTDRSWPEDYIRAATPPHLRTSAFYGVLWRWIEARDGNPNAAMVRETLNFVREKTESDAIACVVASIGHKRVHAPAIIRRVNGNTPSGPRKVVNRDG